MPGNGGGRVTIRNFGGNISFVPRRLYEPRTEQEVLEILDQHAGGRIRVMGARHAWSPAIVSNDVLLDLRNLDRVEIEHKANGEVWATVGGGCRIKHLLSKLHAGSESTLPSLGLITEQTIAGAISTGTHGSGWHSLSHSIAEVRLAAFDPETGQARIYVFNAGPELLAARCALGCMGPILSVRLLCVPKYLIAEKIIRHAAIDGVLALEAEFPLQQFFLIPHGWIWFGQHRRVASTETGRSWSAPFYRWYWFLGIDLALHLIIKLLTCVVRSRSLTRFFFRRILSALILKNQTIVDDSERMLIMEHELFRHFEIELFVRAARLREAARFVQQVAAVFDGAADSVSAEFAGELDRLGLLSPLHALRGTFTPHYPITFRRILPDDTLFSPASGAGEPWYSISLITYVEPRDAFLGMADFLARSMRELFQARPHWGKYCPLTRCDTEALYPQHSQFEKICRRVDPHGVFRNEFIDRVL